MLVIPFRHHGIRSLGFMLRLFEPLALLVCAVIVYFIRIDVLLPHTGAVAIMCMCVLLFSFGASTLKLYEDHALRNLVVSVPRISLTMGMTFGFLLIMLFLFKISEDYSRFWLITWFLSSLLILLTVRWFVANKIEELVKKGHWQRRMAILGASPQAMDVLDKIMADNDTEFTLTGFYSCGAKVDAGDLKKVQSKKFMGDFEALLAACQKGEIDDVIIVEDLKDAEATAELLNRLNTQAINIWYCLPLSLVGHLGRQGLPLVMISRKPLEGHSVWLKRMLDIVASAAILLMILPILGALAIAVKMSSPGPVFFRQKRGGFNGEEFEMLKFRSMRVGASAVKDESGKELQALKDDPRITAVGRFIRKTSLDELPQFINVLRGDMSLVGPRPHVPSHNNYYETLIGGYASRHKMKPGITGWAQLNGWRGETETLDKMAKRVEYDIWYTQNWSFWLDVKIIVLTPFATLLHKTAY